MGDAAVLFTPALTYRFSSFWVSNSLINSRASGKSSKYGCLSACRQVSLSFGSILSSPFTKLMAFFGNLQRYLNNNVVLPGFQWFWFANFRELHSQKSGIFKEHLLLAWSEWAKNLLNEIQLVHFVFSREQRIAISEFAQQATNSPI